MRREIVLGGLIVLALFAFELFNFSTTDFALTDLLGDLRFVGLRWATILAIAFCGMDFAGIARLFTPQSPLSGRQNGRLRPSLSRTGVAPALRKSRPEPVEVWYLLGAWFLAATMNAMLTWWGISLALVRHPDLGNEVLTREQLLSAVPVFVAVLVWLIRILLIGTFSMAGDRLFARAEATLTNVHRTPVPPARVIGETGGKPASPAPSAVRPARSPVPRTAAGASPAAARPRRSPAGSRPFSPAPKPRGDSNGQNRRFQKLAPMFPKLHRSGAGD